jgi:hypothetical protein
MIRLDCVYSFSSHSKGKHHEQRSKPKKGFKETTGKNHERKKGGKKRKERSKDEPWGLQSRIKDNNITFLTHSVPRDGHKDKRFAKARTITGLF